VAKFGAELGAQPDRYFQARRFQAFDAPMLLGQGTPQAQVYGGPTPQISTMAARLAGQDPAAGGGGMDAGPDQVMGTPDDRPKVISQIAKASPPSHLDVLDAQDRATLNLMQTVYERGGRQAPRGSLERLQASGRAGVMQSAGTYLGFDPEEYKQEYLAYRPDQGNARLA
jgi:hypothetical protein